MRDAETGDVEAIVTMAMEFLSTTGYSHQLPPRPNALRAFAERLIAMEDATILLALDGETPIGMLALWAYEHPMSGERVASEIVWWVSPERRGVGVRLLKRAETWARARNATVLQMVAPTDRVGRFYAACGYDAIETMFQRRLT